MGKWLPTKGTPSHNMPAVSATILGIFNCYLESVQHYNLLTRQLYNNQQHYTGEVLGI